MQVQFAVDQFVVFIQAFEFDPAVVFGTAAIGELTVALTPVASPYTKAQLATPIYRILDLENKTWEDITAQDLFSNRYGTYVTNYVTAFAPNWTSPRLTVRDCIIWTGVTNGPTYRTSKLVLRRIPACAYGQWTMGCDNVANTLQQRQVVFTNDYWIGVFKFTQDQYYRYMNSYGYQFTTDHDYYGSHLFLPAMNIAFADVRGDGGAYTWPAYGHAVAPSSCLGKMKTSFGNALPFDIATEAQWEFACRGGCTAYQYNGVASTDASGNLKNGAWTQGNSYTNSALSSEARVNTCVPRMVGLLIPNAFGLYDMIGDSYEWVLDRYKADYLPEGSEPYADPVGPSDATAYPNHVLRSRNYNNAVVHSAFRTDSGGGTRGGFRVCIQIPSGE